MNLDEQIPVFEKFVNDLSFIQQNQDIDIFRDIIIQYPFFQTAQLLYILSKNQIDSIFSDEELIQAAIYCGSRAKLYRYLSGEINTSDVIPAEKIASDIIEEKIKNTDSIIPLKSKIAREQAESIIDKFIQQNPSIQKPLSEFYSPSGMAAKSLEEDADLATETLAKIYIKKGNYAKAIRIYQKLILYYPEKSNYFATLIESLRDKINE
jgi:tetratricopeptide (TPR) repeat protein